MLAPDPTHRARTDIHRAVHRLQTPVGRVGWCFTGSLSDDRLAYLSIGRLAAPPGSILLPTGTAQTQVALPPPPGFLPGDLQGCFNLLVRLSLGGQQDDPVMLRESPGHDATAGLLRATTLVRTHSHGQQGRHACRMTANHLRNDHAFDTQIALSCTRLLDKLFLTATDP